MQNREPSTFEIWSGNVVGRQRSQQPASLWNFLKSDRDAVLVVREPFGDRARAAVLVTAAMVASFGLGWAGGLNWPQFANELGLVAVAQKEAPAPQLAEARSSGRIEGARKTASASDSPAIVGSIPKPPVLLPAVHARSFPGQCRPFRCASRCGSPWWRRRKPSRRRFPAGRLSMFGTAPRFWKVLTEFGWPRAATPFPELDAWSPSCAGAAAGSLPPPAD